MDDDRKFLLERNEGIRWKLCLGFKMSTTRRGSDPDKWVSYVSIHLEKRHLIIVVFLLDCLEILKGGGRGVDKAGF